MRHQFCVVRNVYYDYDMNRLEVPYVEPVVFSILRVDVLTFASFSEAFRYAAQMNTVTHNQANDSEFKVIPLSRGLKLAQQVVDRYREYRSRKYKARLRNCVVLKRKKFTA